MSGETLIRQGTPVQLQPSQQLIISCMRANPKPDHLVGITYPHSTIPSANPHRVNGFSGMYRLPAETRMRRVLPKELIGLPRLLLYLLSIEFGSVSRQQQ